MKTRTSHLLGVASSVLLLAVLAAKPARAQELDATWTITANGQSAAVNPDGSFRIRNISATDRFGPAGPGSPADGLSDEFVRVVGTSMGDRVTRYVFSEPFQIRRGATFPLGELTFEAVFLPRAISLAPAPAILTIGDELQLAVTASYDDGTTRDVTRRSEATIYRTSNPRVAAVGPDGLVTAQARGAAYISAVNSGATTVKRLDAVGDRQRLRISGVLRLPDGTIAVGADVRSSTVFGGTTTSGPDGSFAFTVDVPLGGPFSIIVSFAIGGQRFSRTLELEPLEGIELIDLGTLALVPQVSTDLFVPRVFEAGDRPGAKTSSEAPGSMVSTDLDGDGDLDIATVNVDHTLGVLLSRGDGTFADRVLYHVQLTPTSVAAGDIDGDGDTDLVVTSGNALWFLANRGDGAFDASSTPAQGRYAALGDLNGDGLADLVLLTSNAVLVRLNQGGGVFATAVSLGVGTGGPIAVTLADLDGDDDIDLAATKSPSAIAVLRNQGDGTFAAAVQNSVGINARGAPAVGDFDGDGAPDLAVANANPMTVTVLRNLNLGDATFGAPVQYSVGQGAGGGAAAVAAGDLDADGVPDLVVANSSALSVSVLLNRGDGIFLPQVETTTGGIPAALAIADYDQDGDADVALANTANVQILANQGDGTFPRDYVQYVVGPVGAVPVDIVLGDLDGDGDEDLVTVNAGAHKVSVLRNQGDGSFLPGVEVPVGFNPNAAVLGDLDGDDDADLAVVNFSPASNSVSVLLNEGNGVFAPQVEFAVGTQPMVIALGDVDGDGAADLAVGNFVSRTISIHRNHGNATFEGFGTYGVGGNPKFLRLADIDGDGDLDLVLEIQAGTDQLLLQRNQGDGTFGAPEAVDVGPSPYPGDLGDVDGDGDLDLAVPNFLNASSSVSIVRNAGDGTFAPPVAFPSGNNPRFAALDDLDGDGALDLIIGNQTTNMVSVLLGSGSGSFQPHASFGLAENPAALAIGDLDGDADLDMAVACGGSNLRNNLVSILLNRRVQAR